MKNIFKAALIVTTLLLPFTACIKEVAGDSAQLRIELQYSDAYIGGPLTVRVFSDHDKINIIDYTCPKEMEDPENVLSGREYSVSTSTHYCDIDLLNPIPSSISLGRKKISLTIEDPYTGVKESASFIIEIKNTSIIDAQILTQYTPQSGTPVIDNMSDFWIQFNLSSTSNISSLRLSSIETLGGWLKDVDNIKAKYLTIQLVNGEGKIKIDASHINPEASTNKEYNITLIVIPENERAPLTLELSCYLVEKFSAIIEVDPIVKDNEDFHITVSTNKPNFRVGFNDFFDFLRNNTDNNQINLYKKNIDGDELIDDNIVECNISNEENNWYTQDFYIKRYRVNENLAPRTLTSSITVQDKGTTAINLNITIEYIEEKLESTFDFSRECKLHSRFQNDPENLRVDAYEKVNLDDLSKNIIVVSLPRKTNYSVEQHPLNDSKGKVKWAFVDPDVVKNENQLYMNFKSIYEGSENYEGLNFRSYPYEYGNFLVIIGDNDNDKCPGGPVELKITCPQISDPEKNSKTYTIYSRYSIALDVNVTCGNWIPMNFNTQQYNTYGKAARNPNSDQWLYVPIDMNVRIVNIGNHEIEQFNDFNNPLNTYDKVIEHITTKCIARKGSAYSGFAAGIFYNEFKTMISTGTLRCNGTYEEFGTYAPNYYGLHLFMGWNDEKYANATRRMGYINYDGPINGDYFPLETINKDEIKPTTSLPMTLEHFWKWNDICQVTYGKCWRYVGFHYSEWEQFDLEIDAFPADDKCHIKTIYQRYLKEENRDKETSPWWTRVSKAGWHKEPIQ